MENNLYKQAILDAKAIRAGAIANAKASLEEVIGPKINELVRLNLQEDLEEEEEPDVNEEFDGGEYAFTMDWAAEIEEARDLASQYGLKVIQHPEMPNNNYFISFVGSKQKLVRFLKAEEDDLGGESAEDNISTIEPYSGDKNWRPMDEGLDDGGMEESTLDEILAELESLNEADEADEADDEETDEADETPTDDTKVVDITLGDLKDILKSVMGSGSSTDMEFSGDEENSDMNPDKEDLNLDEILAELEGSDPEKMYEVRSKKNKDQKNKDQKDASKKIEELNEARKTIKSLSSTLNEVNLLNAKLLYVNKIFKEKSLNESQKLKVIKSFDKATTTREAKNVYEILKESLNTKQKTSLKESIGFASQSRGYIRNNNIIESDPFVSRWQKIAGIKN
jgi:hypothetical protein